MLASKEAEFDSLKKYEPIYFQDNSQTKLIKKMFLKDAFLCVENSSASSVLELCT